MSILHSNGKLSPPIHENDSIYFWKSKDMFTIYEKEHDFSFTMSIEKVRENR